MQEVAEVASVVSNDTEVGVEQLIQQIADSMSEHVYAGIRFPAGVARLRPYQLSLLVFFPSPAGDGVRYAEAKIESFRDALVARVSLARSERLSLHMDASALGLAAVWSEEVVTRAEETDVVLCGLLNRPQYGEAAAPLRLFKDEIFQQQTDKKGEPYRLDKISLFGPVETIMTCSRGEQVDSGYRLLYLGRKKRIHSAVRFGDLTISLQEAEFEAE